MSSNEVQPISDGDNEAIEPLPKELEEVLEQLPEDKRRLVQVAFLRERHFQGPLPPPDMLQEYNRVYDGCARDIFDLAKREQEHVHELTIKTINADISLDRERTRIAAALIFVFWIGSFILVLAGIKDIGAGGLLASGGTLIGLYIRSEMQRSRQLPSRSQTETDGKPDSTKS